MEASREFKHEFRHDVETSNDKIYFGESELPLYRKLPNVEAVLYFAQTHMGFSSRHPMKTKESYIKFTEQFGITPTNFKKVYNAIFEEVRIKPIAKYVSAYAWGNSGSKRKPREVVVKDIWNRLDKIKQLEADGNEHLIPFLVYLDEEPHTLKKKLGKGLWKRICKNSRTRNRNIGRYLHNVVRLPGDDHFKMAVERVNRLPSCVIKRGSNMGTLTNTAYILCKHFPATHVANMNQQHSTMSRERRQEIRDFRHVVEDTFRMARQLGEECNENWSKRRWKEMHDEFTYLINAEKYSPEPIEWVKNLPEDVKTIHHHGLIAYVLESPMDIANEGVKMRHCVGGYSHAVGKKNYLVYHIEDTTVEGSSGTTLGLQNRTRAMTTQEDDRLMKFGVNQHYGLGNRKDMMDERHTMIEKVIVDKLNEALNDE